MDLRVVSETAPAWMASHSLSLISTRVRRAPVCIRASVRALCPAFLSSFLLIPGLSSLIARNYESSGGYDKTLKDFFSLNPSNIKEIRAQYGVGKVGYTGNRTTAVARPGSATGGTTLEIRESNSKIYKIRY